MANVSKSAKERIEAVGGEAYFLMNTTDSESVLRRVIKEYPPIFLKSRNQRRRSLLQRNLFGVALLYLLI